LAPRDTLDGAATSRKLMTRPNAPHLAALPSVDRVLKLAALSPCIEHYGIGLVSDVVREVLADLRRRLSAEGPSAVMDAGEDAVIAAVEARAAALFAPRLRPVRNLTGTVLHTNLGRAPLPPVAIEAMVRAAQSASNLEYDIGAGRRGDRDGHVEEWLCRLTGAEAATVVNNNAAAVLLALNSLALRKEVVVSRGELIEIGGAFRLPDIMTRAGCRRCEVGTTNRTHRRDYEEAVSPRSGLILKVHTSNYAVQGFTAAVGESALAEVAQARDLPLVVDLGSGTLVPLEQYGLPHEPTAGETLAKGADLVTFSGDKLLGGPQAGIIVGRKDLVERLKRNPLKRALRVDKLTLAALGAVLPLYGDPERLAERLPALRLLTRPEADIRAQAERLAGTLQRPLEGIATVTVTPCASQIGSGALPVETLPSAALALRPAGTKKAAPGILRALAAALRRLPTPVIGRISDGALTLDLRCLEDEAAFAAEIESLALEP
jgi:L-seryl-tRNA(Ser) seleniumtransferase